MEGVRPNRRIDARVAVFGEQAVQTPVAIPGHLLQSVGIRPVLHDDAQVLHRRRESDAECGERRFDEASIPARSCT